MDIIQALLLGIIQGIFEWLPVSSEGQSMLILFNILNMSVEEAFSIAIFLHMGTCFAVLIKFRKEYWSILSGQNNKLARIILISTLCTAVTGLPLYLVVKSTFSGGTVATVMIGFLLIITGIFLGIKTKTGHRSVESVTYFDMVLLGLVQGFAILPGISRSGMTITTLLIRNIDQKTALIISFLISVPVVIGAILLDMDMILTFNPLYGLVMFFSSLVIGYYMMDFLLQFAEKVDFSLFCIILGLLTVILSGGYYIYELL